MTGAEGEGKPGEAKPEKTRLLHQWKHASPLISCRFDPTGRFVFAGAEDSKIVRWDLDAGEPAAGAKLLVGHTSWVRGMAFDATGATMVSGDYVGRLLWWEAAAAEPKPPLRTVEAHDGWVRAVATSPRGELIASAGNDRLVKLWSLETGELVRVLTGHESHVYNVLFHPDGASLASADLKGVVRHWNAATGECLRKLDAAVLYKYDEGFRADIGGARSMAFRADGKELACGGITNVSNAFAGVGNPIVLRFDWEKGTVIQSHVAKEKYNGAAWGVAFRSGAGGSGAGGDFLIGASGGGGGGYLLFWKAESAEEFFQLKLPDTARDLALHRDGLRIATAHYDGHLRLWTMEEPPPAAAAPAQAAAPAPAP